MGGNWADRIERATDASAALLLASAVAFAMHNFASDARLTALAVLIAGSGAYDGLRRIRPTRTGFAMAFEAVPLALPEPVEELVLGEADAPQMPPSDTSELAEAMLLDDALLPVSQDSRVVQLFGPRGPTAVVELMDRIERHFGQAAEPEREDASEALLEALFDLRRSLRNSA